MNCKEHHLPELELATEQVREGLQCLLHTILFIRAPGPVAPRDVMMEDFDLTYTRIASVAPSRAPPRQENRQQKISSSTTKNNPTTDGCGDNNDVDQKVDDAIEQFLQSLTPIGPELFQGYMNLIFFERRASKQLFGFVSHEERVVWETWVIRVVVNTNTNTNNTPPAPPANIMERQRLQDTAEQMLKSCLQKIFDCAGESIDHIPPIMYEFEINSITKGTNNNRENMRTRVTNMPKLIQLG